MGHCVVREEGSRWAVMGGPCGRCVKARGMCLLAAEAGDMRLRSSMATRNVEENARMADRGSIVLRRRSRLGGRIGG